MSIYDQDPDTGLTREPARPDPVTDGQVTAQRARDTRARYNRLYVRELLARRYPEYSRAVEIAVRVIAS